MPEFTNKKKILSYMNYDSTLRINDIDYGVIIGNKKIVFIKTGLGGSCFGYENKYIAMARRLRERYGCSVIVASNPNNEGSHLEEDAEMIGQYASEQKISDPEFFFFGHSNGGIKGIALASARVAFKKMILVNMPLMINFHKTKRYILSIPQTEITAIYGEQDPSFSYIPFLDKKAENIKVITIPGADHNFEGLQNEFIRLCDRLLD